MKIFKSVVINFHDIHDRNWMEMVLVFLKRNFNIITTEELEAYYFNNEKLKNACLITFDDGDISFYETVYPLLKEHSIPVTLFVSSYIAKSRTNFWFQEIRGYDTDILMDIVSDYTKKTIEINQLKSSFKSLCISDIWNIINNYQNITASPLKPPQNMTIEQILEVHHSGYVTIGAHTMNHPILANENDKKVKEEIEESINDLSKILGSKIKYFAYPNGIPGIDFNQREMDILNKNGIKLAFSTEKRTFTRNDNHFSIPRNGISYGNKMFLYLKLIFGNNWSKIRQTIHKKNETNLR